MGQFETGISLSKMRLGCNKTAIKTWA